MSHDPPTPYADALMLVQTLAGRWQARLIETHISWVLLDGTHAWKFKKPVRLPFVDFTGLQTRQHLCEQELRLNRRLAPSLYLDVLPVCGTPQAPQIGGTGEPIDWVLRMRQFAPGALMSERLRAGTVTPAQVDQLVQRLAAFHRAAPKVCDVVDEGTPAGSTPAAWGSPARIVQAVQALLDGLSTQHRGHADAEAAIATLRAWCAGQARQLHDTWLQRRQHGHVVEGHGDLHLANVVVLDDGEVTAFDCIEFDPALRWIDALDDIAFLIMDLMAHGREDLAWRGLNRYLDDSGDHAGLPVLRHDLVGRALVRAMVAGLPGAQRLPADAASTGHTPGTFGPDYLALALRLTQAGEPGGRACLLITHGLSGSGKSWQTQHLLERAGAIRLRSDVVRRQLGFEAAQRYGPAAMAATYARLHQLADIALRAGYPVIVDATFLLRADRARFAALAAAQQLPFAILHCQAPLPVLQQRIRERLAQGGDASEADEAVPVRQMQAAEALTADEQACAIGLDATQAEPLAHLLSQWMVSRSRRDVAGSMAPTSASIPLPVDVCNGDADGLCAALQWRLAHPGPAHLVTGLKREIDLLGRVWPQAGGQVRVFDLSMQRNRAALLTLLDAGMQVLYVDHHDAGEVPVHPRLVAHIEQGAAASHTCTSLITDRLLGGAHRAWALVGAYGDNLGEAADALARVSGLAPDACTALRQLGEAINHNAYGECADDVCIAPAELFACLLRHPDPFDFIAHEPVASVLVRTREADMQQALGLAPHWQGEQGRVYLMPDKAWCRRASGSFANALACAEPGCAHAVLTPSRNGALTVSVRAPLRTPAGADVLCRAFGGNGRARAAGIDALPPQALPRFLAAFAATDWAAHSQ